MFLGFHSSPVQRVHQPAGVLGPVSHRVGARRSQERRLPLGRRDVDDGVSQRRIVAQVSLHVGQRQVIILRDNTRTKYKIKINSSDQLIIFD